MRTLLALGLALGLTLGLASTASAVGTPAGTTIKNKAFADYKDANGNSLTRVFSNEVQTVVAQVAGTDVSPATASKPGVPGQQTWFNSVIENTGNGTDTLDLSASNDEGWTVTIYEDTDGNGIWDPNTETTVVSSVTLDEDETQSVIVVVTAPDGAAQDDASDTTLTATSQFDGNETDQGVYTTTVVAAVLDLAKTSSPTDPQPGDTVTYKITLKNTGISGADALNVVIQDAIPANTTFVANSIRVGAFSSTYATATANTDDDDVADNSHYDGTNKKVVYEHGTEAPETDGGTGKALFFQVSVNEGVTADTQISNTASGTYEFTNGGTSYNSTSGESVVTVDNEPAVTLDPNRSSSADPGDEVVYAFTLSNDGNDADTIDITYNSSAGWTYVFWKDTNEDGIAGNNGDVQLTDTDGDGVIDSGEIAQDGSIPVLAVATVPAGTADQTVDTTTVTGTSSVDTNVSEPTTLTTTVTAPVLKLTKSVSPTGNQEPGTELVYTIEVENTGTGTATAVVLSDLMPTYTTYKDESILTGSALASLVSRSDANDGDGAKFDAGSDAVVSDSSSLGSGGKLYVRFTVTID